MKTLPDGTQALTSPQEVRAVWGELFTLPVVDDEGNTKDGEFELFDVFKKAPVMIGPTSVFVELRRPIHAGPNVELTNHIELREPTVADVRLSEKYKSEVDKLTVLLGALGQVPNAEIERLTAYDFKLCGEVIEAFLP